MSSPSVEPEHVPTAVYRHEAEALAAELKRRIAGEVRFDAGQLRALRYRFVDLSPGAGWWLTVMPRLSMATSTQPRSR
jgi:hypothetical protein